MIALTKILIAALISVFCAVTGLNMDGNQNIVKKENVSNIFDSPKIITCPKNPEVGTV